MGLAIPHRRERGNRFWWFLIALVGTGLLIWQWQGYRQARAYLAPGTTLGGISVSGLSPDEAVERVTTAYSAPVLLHYEETTIPLYPEEVAFRINWETTRAALEEAHARAGGVRGFLAHLFRRPPPAAHVPIEATYSEEALRDFLNLVAQQYDRDPEPPRPVVAELKLAPGEPGTRLKVEAALPLVTQALYSPDEREVTLPVEVTPPPPASLEMVGELIQARAADFPGVVSVFVKDLQTGEELALNAEVAYAGMSIVKVAIVEEFFRYLDRAPNVEETKLLTETLTLSGNFTANLLLREIGEGDAYRGAERVTESMHRLGLVNTFIAVPYEAEMVPPTIVTPANSRTDINTQPDPAMQTTPLDMGMLLEMIYQCSRGGGTLLALYPNELTPEECGMQLEIMKQNKINSLIETGIPPDTPLAHKHGWIGDTHADAGIVFSPQGDFVLVIYLYNPGWLEWEQSAPLISDIATAVYNYFNPPG